ncbi:hypothetical protein [Bradyrhizobium jicamae]|uniref:hypothetical protein n=1 Tax=Bradyrhizobium jicamae TaxID=280332 RepID=UPI001BA7D11E|nr:hypothetical protein [Bradyrhizobium jicamae]MBR0935755.1 hypothetical protein [Bradyrhizobium jicamae]
MIRTFRSAVLFFVGVGLSGCITTSMQGYADRELPAKRVGRIIAYVAAPGPLAASIQSNIRDEAQKRNVAADDALNIFPPTRKYNDAEIRKGMAETGVDAVLLINVGDSGVQREYAGTILSGQYSGTSSANGTISTAGLSSNIAVNGTSYGTMTTTATPTYRYRRQTNFSARLMEASSGRNLWVGNGQVDAGGLLFVGDGANASSSVSAIFDDLKQKGII